MSIFRINSNVSALNAQRHLAKNSLSLRVSMERLASGSRINKSADDAAGMVISEQFRSQLAGMRKASENVARAISMIQIAEGGYGEIEGVLTRLRELSVQAADGVLSEADRTAIQVEIQGQLSEIDRITEAVTFNEMQLLTGGTVGSNYLYQVGAGGGDENQIHVNIKGAATNSLGVPPLSTITSANFGTAESAAAAIDVIGSAIVSLNLNRADIGAFQNRLERVTTNLETMMENTQAADSVIRDADMAVEVAAMTRAQILVQAGTSILGQANMIPQHALSLLP